MKACTGSPGSNTKAMCCHESITGIPKSNTFVPLPVTLNGPPSGSIDMKKLLAISAEKQLFFAPGAAFHVDYKEVPYLRLAFGHVPDDIIVKGMEVLATCIANARTSNAAREFDSLF